MPNPFPNILDYFMKNADQSAPPMPYSPLAAMGNDPTFGLTNGTLGNVQAAALARATGPSQILDYASPLVGMAPDPWGVVGSVALDTLNNYLKQTEPQRANRDYTDALSKLYNDALVQRAQGPSVPIALRGIL